MPLNVYCLELNGELFSYKNILLMFPVMVNLPFLPPSTWKVQK